MKNYGRLFIALLWVGMAGIVVVPAIAEAQTPQCVSNPVFINNNTGPSIVAAIFGTGASPPDGIINSILNVVSSTFYNNIVENPDFGKIVYALMLLYLVIYGAMIMFNMIPVNTGDVISRLIKIGIIYAMVSPNMLGWAFFYNWVGGFFMGGMNELITYFSQAGVAGGAAPVAINQGMGVNPGVMSALVGPIGQVFSAKFMVIIMSLFSSGEVGWVLAFLLIWALIDFIFMVIGAMGTYIKSVIGLAFLFGIAPIFFLFLLFDKTRQVFFGWLNQVVAFSLTPVMLFAFLAFYCQLISGTLTNMLTPPVGSQTLAPDFCWAHWFSIPGLWDFWWWLPVNPITHAVGGVYQDAQGNPLTPPLNILDILYFLLLCHLGKSFSEFIERLAQDISQGSGPGVIKGGDVSNWFKNNLTGGHSPAGWGAAIGTAAAGMGWGYAKLKGTGSKTTTTGSRRPLGTTRTTAGGTTGSPPADDTAAGLGGQRSGVPGATGDDGGQAGATRSAVQSHLDNMAGKTHMDDALKDSWLNKKKNLAGLYEAYKSAKTPEERNEAADSIVRTAITAITDTAAKGEDELKQIVDAVEGMTGINPKKK